MAYLGDIMPKNEKNVSCNAFVNCLDVNFEKPIMVLGLIVAIFLIVYQSIGQYIFAKFFPSIQIPFWTERISPFLFIWSSYAAIPLTIKNRDNIRVDILYDKLSVRWQGIVWLFTDIVFIIMASCVFYTSLSYLHMQWEFEQYTAALRIPYYIPYAILPLAFWIDGCSFTSRYIRPIKVRVMVI